jgi:hypothetical protein
MHGKGNKNLLPIFSWIFLLSQQQGLLLLLLLLPLAASSNSNGGGCPRSYSLTIPSAAVPTHANKNKLIIAHRGACFHFPEHTIPAYRLGLEMGADFIEPDLVATSDGRLIALHTADLNVTTDVMEKFPDRQPHFSPFMNRSGYWTYNFTLEEIQTLRVKQRLPRARTTAYDGVFSIPTFVEIQQLINSWNEEQEPQILLHVDKSSSENNTTAIIEDKGHHHYQQFAGQYAELKAAPWFAKDANINLVDVFLDELSAHADVFAKPLECSDAITPYDEYLVPPLVIQSFEGDVLLELETKWKSHPTTQGAPVPPMILLVHKYQCWEEPYWFEVGEKWRQVVQGLGVDKVCFPKIGPNVKDGQGAIDRAKEFNLVIHPWTERPEHEFLLPGFQDGFEETQYLLCHVGGQGVFSESVHTAIMAVRMGCPGDSSSSSSSSSSLGSSSSSNKDNKNSALCWEDEAEADFYVGLASFVMGAFVAAIISIWLNRRYNKGRPPRQEQLPTEDHDDGGIEETPDDEML